MVVTDSPANTQGGKLFTSSPRRADASTIPPGDLGLSSPSCFPSASVTPALPPISVATTADAASMKDEGRISSAYDACSLLLHARAAIVSFGWTHVSSQNLRNELIDAAYLTRSLSLRRNEERKRVEWRNGGSPTASRSLLWPLRGWHPRKSQHKCNNEASTRQPSILHEPVHLVPPAR